MSSSRKPKTLNEEIIVCRRCPRLIKYCKTIAQEKRKSFQNWEYWGRPVPNFGDPHARVLIVGLAPAAHGANRTGRMFTGDRSGEWLYRSLHKFSFANLPHSENSEDGLILKDALITATAHCAPPDNKPTREELLKCETHLDRTFREVPFRVVIALGGIAWQATIKQLKKMDMLFENEKKFIHAGEMKLKNNCSLIGSYHPSQQNTFTGRLTEPMFDLVFEKARRILNS